MGRPLRPFVSANKDLLIFLPYLRYLKNYQKYLYSYAYALAFMGRLSIRSGTDACTELTHQVLMPALRKGPFKHAEHTRKELMLTLSISIRNCYIAIEFQNTNSICICALHKYFIHGLPQAEVWA